MQALRVETTISKGGELQVKGLPFRPGEKVGGILLPFTCHRPVTSVSSQKKTRSHLRLYDGSGF